MSHPSRSLAFAVLALGSAAAVVRAAPKPSTSSRAQLDYEVAHLGEEAKGEGRLMRTEVRTTRNGRPYALPIDYDVRKVGSRYRAVDVVTDGVGLVANYRAQFGKIIGRERVDGR